MKDSNFLKERNARNIWHPMAHPGEMQAKPPTPDVPDTLLATIASRNRLVQHLRRLRVEYRGELERAIDATRRERQAKQREQQGGAGKGV